MRTSKMNEDESPENYAMLAKQIYQMAQTEGWSKKKMFDLLQNPVKLLKSLENVRYLDYFTLNLFNIEKT